MQTSTSVDVFWNNKKDMLIQTTDNVFLHSTLQLWDNIRHKLVNNISAFSSFKIKIGFLWISLHNNLKLRCKMRFFKSQIYSTRGLLSKKKKLWKNNYILVSCGYIICKFKIWYLKQTHLFILYRFWELNTYLKLSQKGMISSIY